MSFYRQGPSFRSGGATIGVPPVTPMIKKIIIACGAIFVVQEILRWTGIIDLKPIFGASPALIVRGWIWQPLTYMWFHGGFFHVLFNMLMLWMFGGELERQWGPRAFLRYYLVCGIGASLFIIVGGFLAGDAGAWTVGASGAIYGVLLAFGLVFPTRVIMFFMLFPMQARTAVMIYGAIQFFATMGSTGSGVSHVAHLGGLIVGLVYLKKWWRVGDLYRELRWKMVRRKFKVVPRDEDDFLH